MVQNKIKIFNNKPKNNYPYNFDEVIFTYKNTLWKQFFHLLSEIIEVFVALLKKDYHHASKELWDVSHSSETMNHILNKKYNINTTISYISIINNNTERGYYLTNKKYILIPPNHMLYKDAEFYGEGELTKKKFSGKIWHKRYGLKPPEIEYDARRTLNQQNCAWEYADYDPEYGELTVLVNNLEVYIANELTAQ